jgi:manganese oxidase
MWNVIRTGRMMAAAAVVLVVAAACSQGSQPTVKSATTVQVSLNEFTISPGQIQGPSGSPFTLDVTNQGTVPHSMTVDTAGNTVETPMLNAGQSFALSVPPLDAGTYSVWCTVPGHKEAGMSALLVTGQGGTGAEQPSSGGGSASMPGMGGGRSGMTGEQMADAHKRSTLAFPAETAGLGGEVLEPEMDGDVKVFGLVTKKTKWEVGPGDFRDAFTYNGTVPGPQLRVKQRDTIRVVLQNELDQPTVIHFHGLTVPNAMDGVPYITQDPVNPGSYFVYEFKVVDPPGTYLYHSHFNSDEQVGNGLFGAIVVEPALPTWDVEYTEILSDGPLGYTINGKGFPATQPLTAKLGQDVLIRLANIGSMLHPFHLHGYHFTVAGQDGFELAQPYSVDTLVIAPGERFDVMVKADNPGAWAFHCHILSHVEGPEGMFGMVTALIVS